MEGESTRLLPAVSDTQVISSAGEKWGSVLHPVPPFLLCWSARALLLPGTCPSTLGAEGALSPSSPSRQVKSGEAAGMLGSLQGSCSAGICRGSTTQHHAFCMNLTLGNGGLGFEGLEI